MKSRTRTEYSILNICTGIGGYAVNTVLGFVCRMVFVKYLAADYLGVNGLFSNVLMVLSLAELGIGNAIVFALYRPLAENDEEKIASLMALFRKAYIYIGISVAILGITLIPFLQFIIKQKPAIPESIYLLYGINLFNTVITYFFSYRSALLVASQRNYIVSGLNYLITILQSGIQMFALWAFHSYLWYLGIQTLGIIIYNSLISLIARRVFPCIRNKNVQVLSNAETSTIKNNVRDLFIYKVSGLLVNSTDNILITFFKGLATTGIASNYILLSSTLSTILNQVFNGLTGSVGNHNVTSDNESRFKMFRFLNLMNYWLFGWAALGIVFCSSDIVKLCFGDNYVLEQSIPIAIAVNFYTVGMQNAVWTYKHTLGLFRYGRFLQFVTAFLNIVLSVIFGNKWGVFGILLATFVARLLTNLWYDPVVIFKFGFKKSVISYLMNYLLFLAILAIEATLCYAGCVVVHGSQLLVLFQKILLCSFICNGVFYLCFSKTEEFSKLKTIISIAFNKVVGISKHKS